MSKRWTIIKTVELVVLILLVGLFWDNTGWNHRWETYQLVGFGLFVIYVVLQWFVKIGITIPFIWIIVFMFLAISDWQYFQGKKSFDLLDYHRAILFVSSALLGVIIYFENKKRW